MKTYYAENLSAQRLRRVYEIASPRVRQYLAAETAFAARHIEPGRRVLDLGCGYGRVMHELAGRGARIVGVDNAYASLSEGRRELAECTGWDLALMDAGCLGFADACFATVLCIQNGISAFKVPAETLVAEALRVTRPGGRLLFSSYAERFWPHRLEWFERQSAEGLLGPIDPDRTGQGVIVCRDGFRAVTFRPGDFSALMRKMGLAHEIQEVDGSSLFCIVTVPRCRLHPRERTLE